MCFQGKRDMYIFCAKMFLKACDIVIDVDNEAIWDMNTNMSMLSLYKMAV